MQLTDTGESYALDIRRGIAEFHRDATEGADVVLSVTKSDVDGVLTGQTTFRGRR